jgi:hypothetical protein
MSRNPQFDLLIQQLCESASKPSKCFGSTEQETYAHLARVFTEDMLRTYEAKDQDYASNGKPMGNLRGSEFLGIPAWKAVLLRMSDKKQRISSFINRGKFEVDDEKITDTLIDLANYALLGLILFLEVYDNYHTGVDMKKVTIAQQSHVARQHFFNISVCALKSKILHELNSKETESWNGDTWTELLESFDAVAAFARSST